MERERERERIGCFGFQKEKKDVIYTTHKLSLSLFCPTQNDHHSSLQKWY